MEIVCHVKDIIGVPLYLKNFQFFTCLGGTPYNRCILGLRSFLDFALSLQRRGVLWQLLRESNKVWRTREVLPQRFRNNKALWCVISRCTTDRS